MTYRDLLYKATRLCDKGEITLGEYEEMTKPLDREVVEQESILDKIRNEIKAIAFDWQEIDGEHESFMVVDLNDALNIIDKYKVETEET